MGTEVFHHPPRINAWLTAKVKVLHRCDPGNKRTHNARFGYNVQWSPGNGKRVLSYNRWTLVSHQTPLVLLPAHPVQRMHIRHVSVGSSFGIGTPKGLTSELVRTVPRHIRVRHP